MTTNNNEKDKGMYVSIPISLNPNAEERELLQEMFDGHVKACNKLSERLHAEALRKHDFTICSNLKWARSLVKGIIKTDLHSVHSKSVAQIVVKAYEKAEKHGSLDLAKPILFGGEDEKDKVKIHTVYLSYSATIEVNFKTKICKLDLAKKRHEIPFIFPEGVPVPPDSWEACQGLLKRYGESWDVVADYNGKMAEINAQNVSQVVGVDRGQNNVATTYSDAKGAKRYHWGECYDNSNGQSEVDEHRAWLDKDRLIAQEITANEPEGTVFVLEDLQFDHIPRRWTYLTLGDWFSYFACLHHQHIIYCDPRHTSQKCPYCGSTDTKRENHRLTCNHCKRTKKIIVNVNDDENAARNIKKRGETILRKKYNVK